MRVEKDNRKYMGRGSIRKIFDNFEPLNIGRILDLSLWCISTVLGVIGCGRRRRCKY